MVEILSALAGILLILIIASYFAFVYTFKRRKREIDPYLSLDGEDAKGEKAFSRKLIDDFKLIAPSEEIYIEASDKTRLYARFYKTDKDAPIEIAMHGYRSVAFRDFSGGGLECLSRGHNLLLIDSRAHGKSGGKVITFGILERYDVVAWADYIAKRYPKNKIILTGISMGAASVLMASSLPLPKNVVGVVADCPYSAPCEIIRKVTRDMHLPVFLAYPILRLGGRLFGGFDIEESSPVEAVKKSDLPILLIHGEADDFVPLYMSKKIKEAGKGIRLEAFPEAKHGLSYIKDCERYRRVTNEFINEILERGENINED